MSHITHLYHLSALDFINTTSFPGMAPWTPSYTASDMLVATGPLGATNTTANSLVTNYVGALAIRRKCHTAGALFSGRQPIQNALVPGGVTTLFSSTYPATAGTTNAFDLTGYDSGGPYKASETVSTFKSLMTQIRTFINTKYIPDVLTVAGAYSTYWYAAPGCYKLLAYGDYPVDDQGTLLIKRGIVRTLTPGTFDQANIAEFVDNSYYTYGLGETGLHPFSGRTNPNMTGGYSWIKAPRLMAGTTAEAFEVGPLARMVNTYVSTNQVSVTEADMAVGDSLGSVLTTLGVLGGPAAPLASYNAKTLVDAALSAVFSVALHTASAGELALLYSPLGRHAARALEAKYVADAMAGTANGITGWVDQLVADSPCYTYTKIPKQIKTGYGLTEAPRGALGHWIKIEGRKVAKYQCVVPSTWNFSPTSNGVLGPVEQSLFGTTIGSDATSQIINILRVVHPFDCCIACAVHVVNPEGKETLKFAIGPDGRPTNIEVKE